MRTAILIVALASLAMARRWVVEARVSPSAQARIVEIEASERPSLIAGGKWQQPITEPPTWPGTATYFVPAGSGAIAEVWGICKACSDCKAPSKAFVRIIGEKPVANWRLDASSAPHDVLLDPAKEMRTTFSITASREPDFRIVGDDGRIRDTVSGIGHDKLTFWTQPPFRMVVTIQAHVSIEGPCPTAAPCEPPADAKLAITNVVTEEIVPPK